MKKTNILYSLIALTAMSTIIQAGGVITTPPVTVYTPPVEVYTPRQVVDKKQPSPVYIGLGALWGRYNGSCGTATDCRYEDATYGALLRAGIDINQYFGVEARVLGTFLDVDEEGGEELRHAGLFLKPMLPMGDDVNLYGLLGYAWTQTSAGKYLTQIDDNGLSIGLGVEIDFSTMNEDKEENTEYTNGFDGQGNQEKGFGMFIDYQRLLIKEDVPEMDVVSAGVTFDF